MIDETSPALVTAIHLDAIGGVAGDMFAAALLDVRPDLWPRCEAAIAAIGLPDSLCVERENYGDGVLTGSRFLVGTPHSSGNGQEKLSESHVRWREIRDRLERAALVDGIRAAALEIFRLLANAEAAVHGMTPEEVSFHEVGAVDSLVDIVTAAAIVSALAPCAWTVGPLPRGRGQVRTAHGVLPVPAPAVLELAKGYAFVDDGEEGERVTPTGAAILRYLGASQAVDPTPRAFVGAGIGFGTRRLSGRSNILRASLYGPAEGIMGGDHVAVLRCEIDDQTAEDLAAAIEHLRAAKGVIDICQWPVFGKKGRMATALQVLAEPARADAVAAMVLDETTTLGLRRSIQARTLVDRETMEAGGVPVKLAHRPSGVAAKAEMESLSEISGVSRRQRKRYDAESRAIRKKDEDG